MCLVWDHRSHFKSTHMPKLKISLTITGGALILHVAGISDVKRGTIKDTLSSDERIASVEFMHKGNGLKILQKEKTKNDEAYKPLSAENFRSHILTKLNEVLHPAKELV